MKPKNKTTQIETLGAEVESMLESADRKKVVEKYKPVKEAIQTKKETLDDDSSLYTDMIADFIEAHYEPNLVAQGIIREVNLPQYQGYDSIKIPKEPQLTADSVSADGSVTERDSGYNEITIEPDWQGLKTTISEKLIRKSAVDLIGERLGTIGKAISRKVDSDILNEMAKACTKDDGDYGDNSNYNYLGSSDNLTFDEVVASIASHRDLDAEPDWMVLTPTAWKNLMQDSDMKTAQAYGTSTGNVYEIQQFGELNILVTTQLSSEDPDALLVDSDGAGYLVDQTDIETWDGRPVGKIATEVIGAKSYGVGIVREEAIFGIFEDTDEPT